MAGRRRPTPLSKEQAKGRADREEIRVIVAANRLKPNDNSKEAKRLREAADFLREERLDRAAAAGPVDD